MWERVDPFFAFAGFIACGFSLIVFQAGFVGYFFTMLHGVERALCTLCGLGLMGYLYTRNHMVFVIAVSIIILLFLFQLYKKKQLKIPGS
jgi:hypothetical protein